MPVTAKAVVLIVSIVMPQDVPDISHVERMRGFDVCWKAAKEFAERDLTDDLRGRGALGYKAPCGYQEMPSRLE